MKTFAQWAADHGLSESEKGVAEAAWKAARGRRMKVFHNTEFTGHWPVGTAALVVAENAATAAVLLRDELAKQGLDQEVLAAHMVELKLKDDKRQVIVLLNGNY